MKRAAAIVLAALSMAGLAGITGASASVSPQVHHATASPGGTVWGGPNQ